MFSFGSSGGSGGGFSFGGAFGGGGSSAPSAPEPPRPSEAVNQLRAIVHTPRRGDLNLGPGGGVYKRISTGGRAPRFMMASKPGRGGATAAPPPEPSDEEKARQKAEHDAAVAKRAANDALQQACGEGNVTALRAALANPLADPNADGGMALRLAAAYGKKDAAVELLAFERFQPERIPSEDDDGGSGGGGSASVGVLALTCAAFWGHCDTVNALLGDERIDPSGDSNLPLEMAAEKGHAGVVQTLLTCPRLKLGAATAAYVRPATMFSFDGGARGLYAAAIYQHMAVLDLLLADGRIDPSSNGNAALHVACEGKRVEALKRLLADARVKPMTYRSDSDSSSSESSGFSALRLAVASGSVEVVGLLADDGRMGLRQTDEGSPELTALRKAAPYILMAAVRCREGQAAGAAMLQHLLASFPAWAHPSAGGNAALRLAVRQFSEGGRRHNNEGEAGESPCLSALLSHPQLDLSSTPMLLKLAEVAHNAPPSLLLRVLSHPSVTAEAKMVALRAACRHATVYYSLTNVWTWLMDPSSPLAGDTSARATAELQCLCWAGEEQAYAKKADAEERGDGDESTATEAAAAGAAPQPPLKLVGSLDRARQLLAQGADPGIDGSEALVLASAQGHIPLMQLLLAEGRVDPNAQRGQPLVRAAGCGDRNIQATRLLLADPRTDASAGACAAYRYIQNTSWCEETRKALLEHPTMASAIASGGGMEAFAAKMQELGDGGDEAEESGTEGAGAGSGLPYEARWPDRAKWQQAVDRAVFSDYEDY